jgi:hypothetical protein
MEQRIADARRLWVRRYRELIEREEGVERYEHWVKENDYEFGVPLDVEPPNFAVRRVLVDKLANAEKDAGKWYLSGGYNIWVSDDGFGPNWPTLEKPEFEEGKAWTRYPGETDKHWEWWNNLRNHPAQLTDALYQSTTAAPESGRYIEGVEAQAEEERSYDNRAEELVRAMQRASVTPPDRQAQDRYVQRGEGLIETRRMAIARLQEMNKEDEEKLQAKRARMEE